MGKRVGKRADRRNDVLYCSFCGKPQNEVTKLIAGPTVYICDECIGLCVEIIKEDRDLFKERSDRIDEPIRSLTRPSSMPPELAQMSLLDFLRKHRGSPAISNLTVGDVLTLCQDVAQSLNPTGPSVQPEPCPMEDASEILWKLKDVSGVIYNFRGLYALQTWISYLPNRRAALISLDGKEWKRYGDFVDTMRQETERLQPGDFSDAIQVQADKVPTTISLTEVFRGTPAPTDDSEEGIGAETPIPFVDLRRRTIQQEVLRLLPRAVCQSYEVFPVEIASGTPNCLVLAMAEPTGPDAAKTIDEARAVSGYIIKPVRASGEDIMTAIAFYMRDEESDWS